MSKVDTRQPQGLNGEPDLVTPFVRAGWEHCKLDFGDYELMDSIGAKVLIEDKPWEKLLEDMKLGVLQRQCRGLVEACQFPILLIRGHLFQKGEYLLNTRITWEGAWNQLQSIQDMGCRLQLVTGIDHAIQRIFELERYYAKEWHDSLLRSPAGNPQEQVLGMVEGIGPEKAKAIKQFFGNLKTIGNADIEELIKVQGVGDALAKRIQAFFQK